MMIKIFRPVAAEFGVSSPYGQRTHPITGELGKMHYGIDLKTPIGTPVVASVTGKIILAGWEDPDDHGKGYGLRIWQKDDERDLFVVYAHLSEIFVNQGDSVIAGTRISLSGDSGAVQIHPDGRRAAHLHHEVRVGGIAGVKGSDFTYTEVASKGVV